MSTIQLILFVLAASFFALDFFRVPSPRVSWTPGGFCCLTIALFLL